MATKINSCYAHSLSSIIEIFMAILNWVMAIRSQALCCVLHARSYIGYFAATLCNGDSCCYYYLKEDKTEAQRGFATCPKTYSKWMAGPELECIYLTMVSHWLPLFIFDFLFMWENKPVLPSVQLVCQAIVPKYGAHGEVNKKGIFWGGDTRIHVLLFGANILF